MQNHSICCCKFYCKLKAAMQVLLHDGKTGGDGHIAQKNFSIFVRTDEPKYVIIERGKIAHINK